MTVFSPSISHRPARSSLSACGGLVATTHGASGATLHKNGQQIAEAPAPAVKAIDTVGAGDTFTAALVLKLVEQVDPGSALRFACAAGAAATLTRGAQPALPTSDEVAALL